MTLDKANALDKCFRSAMLDSFSFLVGEYGFEFSRIRELEYMAKSRSGRIRFLLETPRNIPIISIQPVWLYITKLDLSLFRGKEIGLLVVARIKGGNTVAIGKDHYLAHEIRSRLTDLAELMVRYCKPYLEGDYSDWEYIEDHALEVAKHIFQEKVK